MQTFLPYPDFRRSAEVLDDRRLGKQRVETLQILRALHCEGYGWGNHPAVTMWRGHTPALVAYGVAVVDAWRERGYGDSTRANITEFVHPDEPPTQQQLEEEGRLPPWLGWDPLHRSHRAALLRKDPAFYAARFDDAPAPDLPYVWPDPPVPPAPAERRSAWVVRGHHDASSVTIDARADEDPWVPLDARTGRISKRDRQVARFVDEMRPGDVVVVAGPDRLPVGQVTGDACSDGALHRRPVAWRGTVRRAALEFPAALQDPQAVFALWDEPLVEAAAGRR